MYFIDISVQYYIIYKLFINVFKISMNLTIFEQKKRLLKKIPFLRTMLYSLK